MPSGPGRHPEPVFRRRAERRDVREVWCRALGLRPELGLRLEPVFRRPAERRDVPVACCQALALRTARVRSSEPEASPGERPALRASEWGLPSGPALHWAQAAPQQPAARLREAEVSA